MPMPTFVERRENPGWPMPREWRRPPQNGWAVSRRGLSASERALLDSVRRRIYNLIMTNEVPRASVPQRMATECIAVRVRLINRVVSAIYDEALRPFGIRISQGNILVAVARLGEARPADVCRLLRIEKSTLSRDVEIMKARGWLESEPPGGGRNQVLRVTPSGMDLLERSRPAWESAQEQALQLIGDRGVGALRQIASKLGFGTAVD